MKNYIEFLSRLPMFAEVGKETINKVASNIVEKKYRDQEIIFEENTTGDELYIVYSGAVEIIKNYKKQNQKLLSVLTQNEIFGETSLFTKSKRSATAVAKGETVVHSIKSEVFIEIFKVKPEEGIKIVNWMLSNAMSRLEQTSKELASIYSISQIMLESVSKIDDVKDFLDKIATEVENVLPQGCSFGIYLYNIFNDEYEQISYKGEYKPWIKEVFEKNDIVVQKLLRYNETVIDNDNVYVYYFREEDNITGFILLITDIQFCLSQRNKDLLNSISNLISVSVSSLKNLYEQKSKLRLETAKTKYTF